MTRPLRYVLAAAALLLPCVWQPRIHAGDLSSHIYNAWLATLVEKGQAPGLFIQSMYTNVLFDVYLEDLFKAFGAAWAQRIAAGSTVLVFAAGLFAYLRAMSLQAVSGRRPWFLFPAVAMLAYGWVFHMGFFNFLLSVGFALMALALLFRDQRPSGWRLIAAGGLLALSAAAHFVPAAWAAGIAVYRLAHRRLKPRWTPVLFAASGLAIGALRLVLNARYQITPAIAWGTALSGADQFWVFGNATFVFVPIMLLAWGLLFMRLVDERGPVRILLGFPAQVVLLNMAAIMILPGEITPPGYQLGFTFVTQRLSLFVAIAICALLASARPHRLEMALMTAACVAFFAAIYVKGRELDRLEDQVDRIVATLPPGSTVVAPLGGKARTGQWGHIIDRACVGHCFSYANYEPGTRLFRVRLSGPSPAAASDFVTSFELQAGIYNPPPGSRAYYEIDDNCGKGQDLCLRYVDPGPAKAAGQ